MADWSTPGLSNLKIDLVNLLKTRDVDAVTLAESPTNPPSGYKRWVSASNKFQTWNGSAWVDLVLSIEGGGTGGATASASRTALGIGTMGTQNSNAVSISGGAIAGLSSLGSAGNATIAGLIIAGSSAITLTNSSGQILETAIANGNVYTRRGDTETITSTWTFNNPINGTVVNGVVTNIAQAITARKTFTGSQNTAIGVTTAPLGGLELTGDGTNAAFLSFHRPGVHGSYFGVDTDNVLKWGGWSIGAIAHVILHSANIGSYAAAPNGSNAFGSWPINITGTAPALTTARNINGVSFNGTADITVTAAAGTLTGGTLAAGVTASSLTSVGTLTGLLTQNGSAATPAIRVGIGTAGLYYNPTNPTLDFGVNFSGSNRATVRATNHATLNKIDVLVGGAIQQEWFETQSIVGVQMFTEQVLPTDDNTHSLGGGANRWTAVHAVNGTIQTSDIRHKRNHGTITNALDKIRRTETFIGSWNYDEEAKDKFPSLSAQNVREVWDKDLGTNIVVVDQYDVHAMYYNRMMAGIIAGMKELDAEVQRLRKD